MSGSLPVIVGRRLAALVATVIIAPTVAYVVFGALAGTLGESVPAGAWDYVVRTFWHGDLGATGGFCQVQLRVNGAGVVRGELALATAQWVLVHHDALTDWVVSLDQVVSVRSGERSPALARGEVQRRLSWRYAWAALHRDADEVHVILIDGSTLYGAPTRVGKDYVEIAGEIVPFASVVALRCPR